MSSRTGLILGSMLCAVALVYAVGSRLPEDTVNLLVGVACGVAASIPVSLGLVVALLRRRESDEEPEEEPEPYAERPAPYSARLSQPPYPQVIVVAPPQAPLPGPYANLLPPGYNLDEPPRSRDFRIIGDEGDDQ